VGGLGLKDMSSGVWVGAGWRVPEPDAALNCSVPERCIKYASDCSYAATVADDLHRFILTKIWCSRSRKIEISLEISHVAKSTCDD
jgi:hypothetical protein